MCSVASPRKCESSASWIHQPANRQCRHGAEVLHSRGRGERFQSSDILKSSIIVTHLRCFFSHSESLGANGFLPPGLVFRSGKLTLPALMLPVKRMNSNGVLPVYCLKEVSSAASLKTKHQRKGSILCSSAVVLFASIHQANIGDIHT